MQLHGESSRKTSNPPEPSDELEVSQNTSNNGHKYIPEEIEIHFLHRNFYPNGTCIFKDRHPGTFPIHLAEVQRVCKLKKGEILRRGEFYTEPELLIQENKADAEKSRESDDASEPDIEIVISQDVLSGDLFFNAVFTDELEIFIQTIDERKILATSYSTSTKESSFREVFQVLATDGSIAEPITEYDDATAQSLQSQRVQVYVAENGAGAKRERRKADIAQPPSARSPGAGDSISHTPGLLHVPHMADLSNKDDRHVTFQKQMPETDQRRSRGPFRRKNHEKQRFDDSRGRTTSRTNSRRSSEENVHTTLSDTVNTNPPYETRSFYSGRYYNTNTYCSETSPCKDTKLRGKEQSLRWSQENRGGGRTTNTSWSEGDLPRSRQTCNDLRADMSQAKKLNIKKRESNDSANKLSEEVKDDKNQCVKEQDVQAIASKTDQKQMYTQSVSISGTRVQKPMVSEHADCGQASADQAKKKRNRTNKKSKKSGKLLKSQMEILQRQIDLGQLKSFFSKYRTDGLKNLRLLEELHTGTFSTKYKAIYQNETVLLSVYCDQDVSDIAAVDMAHMRRSYFVACLKDCIRGPGQSLWLMTKFCRLGDLNMLLLRDRMRHVIGEIHAQFIVAGLLIGVEYLHRNDIVHGNIKPSKILFNNEGFPVLTGFLKIQEGSDIRDVYTPAYAAPERFRGDRGPAVDIFSMGCVAYEIITGRTPFDGGNLDGTKARIISSTYRPWYDPELVSYAGELFVDLCLKKKVCDRFTLGESRQNLRSQEWFSTLDLSDLRRQIVRSPILDAIQLLNNRARMTWEEKMINYNWGRVMDDACPDKLSLQD